MAVLALLGRGDASPLSLVSLPRSASHQAKPAKAAKHRRTPKEPKQATPLSRTPPRGIVSGA
jgi:hypothetical protein